MSKVKFLDIQLCERTNHYQTFVTIRSKQKIGVHSNKKKMMLLGMPFRMLMMVMMMLMVMVMMVMMMMIIVMMMTMVVMMMT